MALGIGGAHLINAKGDFGTGYTIAEYIEMKSRARSVEGIILNDPCSMVMTQAGLPEAVNQKFFFSNAFEFFEFPPLFGRTFTPQDAGDEFKVEPVAVRSYLFWQRHFLGRRDAVSRRTRDSASAWPSAPLPPTSSGSYLARPEASS